MSLIGLQTKAKGAKVSPDQVSSELRSLCFARKRNLIRRGQAVQPLQSRPLEPKKARLCYFLLNDVLIPVIPCDPCEAYFGASEATIFSKRGSPRSGSQKGSSFN